MQKILLTTLAKAVAAAYAKRHPKPIFRGSAKTTDDMMTFDAAGMVMDHTGAQINGGAKLNHPATTTAYSYKADDGQTVYVQGRTVDSTGAFLVGELERLDMTEHDPLYSTTWGRDIDLREDVTIADEVSSFTVTTFASQGGLGTGNSIGTGKAWMGKASDQISGLGVDIAKIVNPLTIWMLELKYTIFELASSARVGRPIDAQKYNGIMIKNDMDTDEQVYIGDTSLAQYGLLNSNNRTGLDATTNLANVAVGQAGGTGWMSSGAYSGKTPAEILQDVNEILVSAWAATGYSVMPNRLLLPPTQFGYISTQLISVAGSISILRYLLENNITVKSGAGGKLDIVECKWCVGAGAAGTYGVANGHDRMVAYSKRQNFVRFPKTAMDRTQLQYDSVFHKTSYYCRLGQVEWVYPETWAGRDGL